MLRNRTLLILLMLHYVPTNYTYSFPRGNQQTEICERARQRILTLFFFIALSCVYNYKTIQFKSAKSFFCSLLYSQNQEHGLVHNNA